MDGRQAFGVFARSIGLLLVLYGFYVGAWSAMGVVGVPLPTQYPLLVEGVATGFYVVGGLILLLKAEWIVRAAYGR
jgi:hypothetical protein